MQVWKVFARNLLYKMHPSFQRNAICLARSNSLIGSCNVEGGPCTAAKAFSWHWNACLKSFSSKSSVKCRQVFKKCNLQFPSSARKIAWKVASKINNPYPWMLDFYSMDFYCAQFSCSLCLLYFNWGGCGTLSSHLLLFLKGSVHYLNSCLLCSVYKVLIYF